MGVVTTKVRLIVECGRHDDCEVSEFEVHTGKGETCLLPVIAQGLCMPGNPLQACCKSAGQQDRATYTSCRLSKNRWSSESR